jgi:hypothetical protein
MYPIERSSIDPIYFEQGSSPYTSTSCADPFRLNLPPFVCQFHVQHTLTRMGINAGFCRIPPRYTQSDIKIRCRTAQILPIVSEGEYSHSTLETSNEDPCHDSDCSALGLWLWCC